MFIPQSATQSFLEGALSRLSPEDLGARRRYSPVLSGEGSLHSTTVADAQEDELCYIALLRKQTNDADLLRTMLAGNRALYEVARNAGGTLYPFAALDMKPADWRQHYGSQLSALVHAKRRHDPDRVFAAAPDLAGGA